MVEAESAEDARERLKQFPGYHRNYNDLQPEQRKGIQPFRLKEGAIVRMADCEKRHKNIRREYTCGVPKHNIENQDDETNMNGEFGMCCLEGYDFPEDCPLNNLED